MSHFLHHNAHLRWLCFCFAPRYVFKLAMLARPLPRRSSVALLKNLARFVSRLRQEPKLPTILLCRANQVLFHLGVASKLFAKVADDLRVQRDRLAANLVEPLHPDHIARDAHDRREQSVFVLVPGARDVRALVRARRAGRPRARRRSRDRRRVRDVRGERQGVVRHGAVRARDGRLRARVSRRAARGRRVTRAPSSRGVTSAREWIAPGGSRLNHKRSLSHDWSFYPPGTPPDPRARRAREGVATSATVNINTSS